MRASCMCHCASLSLSHHSVLSSIVSQSLCGTMPLNVLCSTIPVTIATPLYHCDYYLEHGHVRNSWFNVAKSAFGHLKLMLEGLQMEMLQFIDLCFLLGCDYLKPIKGIGPKLALKLVHEFSGLEAVLEHLCDRYVSYFSFISCL